MNQSLSYIHSGAKLGNNVIVEPFSYIADNVEIGKGTWIGPNVTILDGARIGKHCKIFPGAVISAIPQDLKYEGEETLVYIGDYTTIRECVTINKGTSDKMKTQIGSHCLIMAYCHVAHDCIVGDYCVFSNSTNLAGHVTIGNYVTMAGMSAVQQFCSIGDYSFVTGASLVRKNVPPYIKVAREPLSYMGVNSVGLDRRGFSVEKIREIQDIYRILFQKNLNTTKALEEIQTTITPSKERDFILDFVRSSKDGIVKGYGAI